MLPYRMLRAFNNIYGLTVMWLIIADFIVAFLLMFLFPPGTILLLWMGMIGLGLAVPVGLLTRWAQRRVARGALGEGQCPSCGGEVEAPSEGTERHLCSACQIAFDAKGTEEQARTTSE